MICVAGTPRSGTSLLTQLLHRSGLNLGPADQLLPASADNPEGYWENLRFVRLNERLLAASGGTWFAPPAVLRPTAQITADAKSVIAQFEGCEPWGWKDPRNAVTFPFWKSLLPLVKVIVCVRHPAETAASLVASELVHRAWRFYWTLTRARSTVRLRGGAPRIHQRLWRAALVSASASARRDLVYEVGLEMWRIYNSNILRETRVEERLVTHYDAMLANPRAELERVLAFAGLDASAATIDESLRAVSPGLRHHRANAPALDPELAALYDQLSREAGIRG